MMKKSQAFFALPVLFVLLTAYTNCSPPSPATGATASALSSTTTPGTTPTPTPTPTPLNLGPQPQAVGFGIDGTGWSLNGGPTVDADVATLTDQNGDEARSMFMTTPVTFPSGFTAMFVYQDVGATPDDADGTTFTVQNSGDGAAALGQAGGALGYLGIDTSLAVALDIYTRSAVAVAMNGQGYDYVDTAPVDLKSGNPIQAMIIYNAAQQTLEVILTDTVTLDNFDQVFPNVDLIGALGGATGYVGFTAGTGGAISTQQVSGFSLLY